MIVVFDHASHFFPAAQAYPHGSAGLDQLLEIPYFFEGLLGSACVGFALFRRTSISYFLR